MRAALTSTRKYKSWCVAFDLVAISFCRIEIANFPFFDAGPSVGGLFFDDSLNDYRNGFDSSFAFQRSRPAIIFCRHACPNFWSAAKGPSRRAI